MFSIAQNTADTRLTVCRVRVGARRSAASFRLDKRPRRRQRRRRERHATRRGAGQPSKIGPGFSLSLSHSLARGTHESRARAICGPLCEKEGERENTSERMLGKLRAVSVALEHYRRVDSRENFTRIFCNLRDVEVGYDGTEECERGE